MAVSKDEILDAIAKLSLMDVVELIADMEKKFGVTAAAPVAAVAAGGGGGGAAAAPGGGQNPFTGHPQENPAGKKGEGLKGGGGMTGRGGEEDEGPVMGGAAPGEGSADKA